MPRSLALVNDTLGSLALRSAILIYLPMPRLKIRNTTRALCLLLVVYTLYYLTVEPWPTNAGIDYGRTDPATDILRHVNMFIGTKNGGRRITVNNGEHIH